MVASTTILLVVTAILTAVFIWSRRTHVYWQRRRIKFVPPTHLLGNLKEVLRNRNSFALQLRDFYFDSRFINEPLVGIYLFHQPALLIRDLQLVRNVLVDDFVSFSDRFASCDQCWDKLGALNLYFAKNPKWREIRSKLSPVFTTGRVRLMFPLMEEVSCDLESHLHKITGDADKRSLVAPIKEICDRYNTDLIASIAFGLNSHSLRNAHSLFGTHSQMFFQPTFERAFDFCVIFFLPKLATLLNRKLFTPLHATFLRSSIRQVIGERERSGVLRNDLIEGLLTLKKEAELNWKKSHYSLHPDFLPAQAASFEVKGIETCSSVLAFALYELARNSEVQQRLRVEILQAYGGSSDSLTYNKVANMQYLDMVVSETLRKYPIVPFLERACRPINKKRFYSFRPHVDCFVRRGMPVYISSLAIHYDPEHWPDPDNFDPERFSPLNRLSHTPMSYLPFGAGPHNCIGSSLAQLQIKLGLIHFLRHHRIEVCEKTLDCIRFNPKFALLTPQSDIFLRIVKCS